MSHLGGESFDDQAEIDETNKHYVELLESGEDAPNSSVAEQSLDLIASLVHGAIVFPGIDSITLRHE